MKQSNKILYKSGDAFLPEKVVKFLDKGIYFDNTKTFYINLWTGLHFLSGFIVGLLYLKYKKSVKNYYWIMIIIHTFWEMWQTYIGMAKPWKLTGGSNLIDSIMDTLAFLLGSYFSKKLFLSKKF